MLENIIVKGAAENNLKNLDVTIPRNKLVVFTGVSGSGKSSLAFGTIFAEGQRRFMESLSSYARQFLGQMQKPNVEYIEGLSPAISIDQKTTNNNPRSTVGTVTEIYDYLRLLYARVGEPHCPDCNRPIDRQSIDQIVEQIMQGYGGKLIMIEAPVVRGKKGRFEKEIEGWRRSGYVRARIDDSIYMLDEAIDLDKNLRHNISIILDRITVGDTESTRINEAVEAATRLAEGLVTVVPVDGQKGNKTPGMSDIPGEFKGARSGDVGGMPDIPGVGDKGHVGVRTFSNKYACMECGISIEELEPRSFSFNSPFGACPKCSGLGFTMEIDVEVVKGRLNLDPGFLGLWNYGKIENIVENLKRRYLESNSDFVKQEIGKLMVSASCSLCHGKRLRKEALAVKIGGINISELTAMPINKTVDFFLRLKLGNEKLQIAEPIVKEVNARLNFLVDVGLHYLTLARNADSLSGGESQRIRLATQIGSGLVGVLYILDEPSIGLHQRDNERLLKTLVRLRDLGNTVIVVEHDEETIAAADFIVDIGPKAGKEGGRLVVAGTPEQVKKCEQSMTGQFLSGKRRIEMRESVTHTTSDKYLEVFGAEQNNLKKIDVRIPVGVLTSITGVSGSGKSSLINRVLYPAMHNAIYRGSMQVGKHREIRGIENFDKVIQIDQSPIGRTPRSNPATYTGVFTPIRELFAQTKDAKERGYNVGRFSFNVRGGRCDHCEGEGIRKIEMHFLPDVYVQCEVCKGKRFNKETLEVKFKGKNIFDILEMTVDEAATFFENIPSLYKKIKTVQDVGLGYIKMGQAATSLSGGEAQRVKLATELSKVATGRTMYILDEPTTGLHSYDVEKLIKILHRLVDAGNTVVVIEHNLDVIKVSDYIIDLGPEGGEEGGRVIAVGTPHEVAKNPSSETGRFLKRMLG